ncbi:hypothetical protein [Kibdelosporangium philippinense]|uniref:hypothetical protein n=1 Tax=Kibdelosporangium philippinense TaxID=211113 RepID=UPI00362326A7
MVENSRGRSAAGQQVVHYPQWWVELTRSDYALPGVGRDRPGGGAARWQRLGG